MKKFTSLRAIVSTCSMAMMTIFATTLTTNAQVIRPYGGPLYSDNLHGGHTIFGNTLTAIYSSGSGSTGVVNTTAMNDFSTSGTGNYTNSRTSAFTNNSSNIQFVDVDGNIDNTTCNSSSADLIMPSGSNTIKFARLYWGGRIDGGTGGSGNINLRKVKIRKGTSGAYTTYTAPVSQIDKSLISSPDSAYQSYIDITTFINNNGAGTYTVADVFAATGSAGSGNYAAWSIAVVYENPAVPYNSVRVYDGFLQVYNGGPLSITLTGLNVPSTPLISSDAYMTALTWEGDAKLAVTSGNPLGDYIKVNGTIAASGVNLPANFWNGTISKNGNFVNTKNPDFKNQMSIDIDELEVGLGYGILSNASQVNIEFGSEADQYFPSLFAFTIRAKDPDIILNKSVSDDTAPFGTLQTNEVLTYTLSGSNIGLGNSLNSIVVDTIPGNVTYVPGSLIVVNAPGFANNSIQTDANDADFAYKGTNGGNHYVKFFIGTGATNNSGGVLQPGETYTLRFKVITPASTQLLSTVVNTARITGQNIFGDLFVDDGTATLIIGATTPVKMSSFTVKKESNDAVLRWTTVSETKNDHFEIERSIDGINFSKMGTVSGNGTSSITNSYSYPDALSNVSAKILYYRLRFVDVDGKGTFSQIVPLKLDGSILLKAISVYPNPFTGNIKLQVNSAKEEPGSIRLINMQGQQVVKRVVLLQSGDNIVIVKDLETVAPGLYVLELRTGTEVMTQKIIKK